LKKLIKKLTAISKSGEKQLEVVKEEITQIKDAYPSPRRSKLVYTAEEANDLLSCKVEKAPGEDCTLVYTADQRLKVLTGKQADALNKPLEGKFKPQLVAVLKLETVTDRRIFAFTNLGNCYKLDIYAPEFACKLSDKGVSLQDMFKEAEEDEYIVAFKEVGERLPIGNLMFFTRKGMIKKTDWAEYDQRKDVFAALKLGDGDEVLTVEDETAESDTIIIVTKGGICLNAKKDDVPVQGRIAAGVRGIQLRDGDSVILMKQVNGEGEIIIATDEGKFKKVIVEQIEVTGRYKKGSIIVSMKEGASVISASYVTTPYALAIVDKSGAVTEVSSESIPIAMQSAKARKISACAEDNLKLVFAEFYKYMDE
jgi:topoisomerase-4 subunit A